MNQSDTGFKSQPFEKSGGFVVLSRYHAYPKTLLISCIMQGTLNHEYGKTVHVVFRCLKIKGIFNALWLQYPIMPLAILIEFSVAIGRALLGASRDLAPIITIIVLFQVLVLQQPFPELFSILAGLGLVIVGLALFVVGLDIGLFPLGETLAEEFALKGSLFWLLFFAFLLGTGTTVAEPALIAVTREGAKAVAAEGLIENSTASIDRYALGVRLTVALSVGAAIVLGVLRILRGWSLPVLIIGGYTLVMLMTFFAPKEIVGLAYDLGGVTTSTVTVPLVTALGVGLARTIRGRDPLTDGFGLIALASLMPMIFVMLFGLIVH